MKSVYPFVLPERRTGETIVDNSDPMRCRRYHCPTCRDESRFSIFELAVDGHPSGDQWAMAAQCNSCGSWWRLYPTSFDVRLMR